MSVAVTPPPPAPHPPLLPADLRPPWGTAARAFLALLERDLAVLRKQTPIFVMRTTMQPLLLLFVFTYVFPLIGQAVGGTGAAAADFSSVLVAGVVSTAMIFQGIQAVALPLVRGVRRRAGDRGPGPGPAAGVGGGDGEDRLRGLPGASRRSHCFSAGGPPAGEWRPPAGRLGRPGHRGAARHPRGGVAGPGAGYPGTAPPGGAPVPRHPRPGHVPRRHLLPLGPPDDHPLAEGGRAGKPAGLHERGVPPWR